MTGDGLSAMTYNAENRTVTSSGAEYVYDGAGIRVRRCLPNCTSPTSRTVYILSGSKVVAESPNQVARFAAYFYVGFHSSPVTAALVAEYRDRGQASDIALGIAAGNLGFDFGLSSIGRGSLSRDKLLDRILKDICQK